MNIAALVARRRRSYDRAIADCEATYAKCRAYESANDGFLSSKLVDECLKKQEIQSHKYKLLLAAERALEAA